MENPFTTIAEQLAVINTKLDALSTNNADSDELLTKKEYLQKRKISVSTLWREETRGLITPVTIGGKKYYKLPK
ncbi:hypothetical protein [Epilithonimonas hominis]|uniref:hypothetical protein n=1 Tax=Epilithonimonas hominis TaxID=420404 RepID=UPI0028A2D95C|nr:hypothetical protein [Epilithonimonas hominis]